MVYVKKENLPVKKQAKKKAPPPAYTNLIVSYYNPSTGGKETKRLPACDLEVIQVAEEESLVSFKIGSLMLLTLKLTHFIEARAE